MAGPAFLDPLAASRGPGADRVRRPLPLCAVPATAVLALPLRWHDRGSTVVADRLGRFLVLRRAIQLLRQDVWLDRRGRHPADVVLCDGVHHPRRRRAEFGNREGAGTQLSAARSRQFPPRLTAVAVIPGITVIAARRGAAIPVERRSIAGLAVIAGQPPVHIGDAADAAVDIAQDGPARRRIMNQAPSTGGAMPHPPSPDDRRAGPRLAISLLVFSALMLSALPLARAAEPEASVEAAPAPGAGPLSPVRREAPAAAQSTSSKQTPVAKKPTITMPAPATTPAADAGASSPPPAAKPQPKEAEQASP